MYTVAYSSLEHNVLSQLVFPTAWLRAKSCVSEPSLEPSQAKPGMWLLALVAWLPKIASWADDRLPKMAIKLFTRFPSLPSSLLGQHHQISQNGRCAGSTRIQGWVRWDWWGDHDHIRSRMVRGQLVEIGASHQIWWNILREHNWCVPSAHIKFIYYVTYILECLIMLQGCVHTGAYTIL